MYPSDITDPKAILSAIAECDALGRQAFLEKYGFAEAKDYFLLYQGNLSLEPRCVMKSHVET